MRAGGHALGFAFDGDGDRVLAVDRRGEVVDGDELLALAALHLRDSGRLRGDGVAVTVMTNYGFHAAMERAGIEVATTEVGDRYVLEELRARGWTLGGEQSGHIIEMGFNRTGDGIASALLTLEALAGRDLAERDAMAQAAAAARQRARARPRRAGRGRRGAERRCAEAEQALAGRGRVLVRPSGTEPLVRVMVEAPTEEEADDGLRAPRRARRARAGRRDVDGAWAPSRSGAGIFGSMCGIVGYVGRRPVQELLLAGLSKLEYRGYDSAGISVIAGERIEAVRAVGNLERAARRSSAEHGGRRRGRGGARRARGARPASGTPAGRPTAASARRTPIRTPTATTACTWSSTGSSRTTWRSRSACRASGCVFTSETDAEVIAHLIAEHYDGDLAEAVRAAYAELEGHYAFVAMSLDEPELLVGARKECPLVVGRGEGEQFVASAVPAFLAADAPRAAHRERRDRRAAPRRRRRSPTADGRAGRARRARRSTGTRRPPRRAATRRSC